MLMRCPKCDSETYFFRSLEDNGEIREIVCQHCGVTLGIVNDWELILKKLVDLEERMSSIEKIFKETLRNKGLF